MYFISKIVQSENGSPKVLLLHRAWVEGKKPQQKNHRENKSEREQGPEGMLEGGLKIAVRMLEGDLKVPMPPLHLWEVFKKR